MPRDFLMKLSVIFFFICMLLFPRVVLSGAGKGLLLWYTSVLPTLLPFIIVSGLLIRTQAVHLIVRVTGPLLRRLFCVSDYGTFAIVTGFLCGYPMGSKGIADLLKEGHITLPEAQYLLSFCNNASPIFIISFIVLQNLKNETLLVPALVILLLSPILCSFLFRRAYAGKRTSGHEMLPAREIVPAHERVPAHEASPASGSLIDTCIMDSIEIIVKVGGYIMLFSILLSLAERMPFQSNIFCYMVLPSLEITNGVSMLCKSRLTEPVTFLLTMMCSSFGGFCAVAQTNCMLEGTSLSIRDYMTKKLITAMVTSLLCMFYLHVFY